MDGTGPPGEFGPPQTGREGYQRGGRLVRRRRPIRLEAAVFLAAGILLVSGVGFFSTRSVATAPPAPSTGSTVAVSIEIQSVSGIDSVIAPSLHFRAGSLVEFTIYNFDPVAVGSPASAAAPTGVFASAPRLELSGPGGSASLHGLDPAAVSHTFTVPSGADPFSVPIPAAPSPSSPSVVTFSVYLNQTGAFVWYCAAYCDDGGLGGPAEMGGSITVDSA